MRGGHCSCNPKSTFWSRLDLSSSPSSAWLTQSSLPGLHAQYGSLRATHLSQVRACVEELHLCSGSDATSCSLSTISRFCDDEGTSFATSRLRTLTCSGKICRGGKMSRNCRNSKFGYMLEVYKEVQLDFTPEIEVFNMIF